MKLVLWLYVLAMCAVGAWVYWHVAPWAALAWVAWNVVSSIVCMALAWWDVMTDGYELEKRRLPGERSRWRVGVRRTGGIVSWIEPGGFR